MYCSRNDGDALSAFAMLSNPSLSSSFGNSAATSTFSPKRSFTAFAYSVRLSLCSATRPGFGAWSAAASSVVSNQCTSESRISGDGLAEPGGGIWLPRSLRIAASNTSGSCTMSAGFSLSNAMPPVRSSRLWQSTQYLPSCAQSSAGCGCGLRCKKYIAGPIASAATTAIDSVRVWRLGMTVSRSSLDDATELADVRPRTLVRELQEQDRADARSV